MEKKKLGKLVLKKDVVSKLENDEMERLKGGTGIDTWGITIPLTYAYELSKNAGNQCTSHFKDINCPTDQCTTSCQAVESCAPMQCYHGESEHVTCGHTLQYSQCPQHWCY